MSATIAGIVSPETTARPVLIDERDGPCEFCAKHERGACDRCGERIGIYQNMGGAGFQSPKAHHYHLELVVDVQGRRSVFEELCLGCYREAFASAYPDSPLPAPPLELTEPKLPPEILRAVEGEEISTGAPPLLEMMCEQSRPRRLELLAELGMESD